MPNLIGVRREYVAPFLLAAVAVGAALAPVPPWLVERWYSLAFYPRVQNVLTSVSNLVPIFLVDVASAALLIVAIVFVRRRVRRDGWKSAARASVVALVVLVSVVYLVFLVTWGLNYRRIPLEQKLAYDASRVTREEAVQLGRMVIQQINDGHAPAHAGSPGPALEEAFADALQALGHRDSPVTGVPKRSLLSFYFRHAGVDGMTDPIFLDIAINPDVLPMERPEVVAHEWAHLAGYADEAEANFIAWLTCVRGDAMARYSGWLSLYMHLSAGLPVGDRRALAASLGDGPQADLRAIAARHARGSPLVQRAQREVYDAYLRANRVEEGIARYSAVARLVLGTTFEPGWTPRRRDS
jgi:hypothetical protein